MNLDQNIDIGTPTAANHHLQFMLTVGLGAILLALLGGYVYLTFFRPAPVAVSEPTEMPVDEQAMILEALNNAPVATPAAVAEVEGALTVAPVATPEAVADVQRALDAMPLAN